MFWKNCLGLRTYKGWYGFLRGEQNATKSEFDPSLQSLLEWLREYRSLDTVTLLLPTDNRQSLAVYATIGLEEEIVQQIRIPLGQGIAGRIAAKQLLAKSSSTTLPCLVGKSQTFITDPLYLDPYGWLC